MVYGCGDEVARRKKYRIDVQGFIRSGQAVPPDPAQHGVCNNKFREAPDRAKEQTTTNRPSPDRAHI